MERYWRRLARTQIKISPILMELGFGCWTGDHISARHGRQMRCGARRTRSSDKAFVLEVDRPRVDARASHHQSSGTAYWGGSTIASRPSLLAPPISRSRAGPQSADPTPRLARVAKEPNTRGRARQLGKLTLPNSGVILRSGVLGIFKTRSPSARGKAVAPPCAHCYACKKMKGIRV